MRDSKMCSPVKREQLCCPGGKENPISLQKKEKERYRGSEASESAAPQKEESVCVRGLARAVFPGEKKTENDGKRRRVRERKSSIPVKRGKKIKS